LLLCSVQQLLKLRSSPLPSWGPAVATDRTDRYDVDDQPFMTQGPDRPIPISNARDLLTVLGPGEFARLMGSSSTTITNYAGSSMTLATNVGGSTVWGSKTSM